jgi:UDP-glucose 4-epimerase
MATIIITEYYGKNGKYWTFNIGTGNGDQVAEVDRIEKGYKIYSGGFPFKTEVTTRTRKDSAFEAAKDAVRKSIYGGVVFKFNVVRWHEK